MFASMIKFAVIITITMATLGGVNSQIASEDEVASIIPEVLATFNEIRQTQTQLADTFNTIANLLQMQSQQIQNMTETMNIVVSVLERQQETREELLKTQRACVENSSEPAEMTPEADEMTTEAVEMTTEADKMTTEAVEMITEAVEMTPPLSIHDCSDIRVRNHSSGIFTLNPTENMKFDAYCDMDTHGGGWTVFQKRYDGSANFYRDWDSYADGFGSLDGEFWLGLQKINVAIETSGKLWELLILLESFDRRTAYAKYGTFYVGDAASNYELTLENYSGTAGDAMLGSDFLYSVNGKPFTTYDRDNDDCYHCNCAEIQHSGWWHKFTTDHSNLNGMYVEEGYVLSIVRMRMYWWYFDSLNSLKASTMMMRPTCNIYNPNV